jgi:hypothetical protein
MMGTDNQLLTISVLRIDVELLCSTSIYGLFFASPDGRCKLKLGAFIYTI